MAGASRAAQAGDLGHRLAGVRRIGREAPQEKAVGGRDLAQDELRRLPVLEIAFGEQHGQGRLPVEVGIDVGGDVDARGAGLVEDAQEAVGLAPQAEHRQLHVGDLDGELRLAADGDDLVDRVPEVAVLAPDVADVAAARGGGDLGQRPHLGAGREDARVVLEAGGKAERARLHLPLEQGAHPRELVRPRHAPEVPPITSVRSRPWPA